MNENYLGSLSLHVGMKNWHDIISSDHLLASRLK
jgi:hypothetical protein